MTDFVAPQADIDKYNETIGKGFVAPQRDIDAARNIGMGEAAGRTVASGLTEGTAGLLALPRTAADFIPVATNYIAGKLGVPENARNAAIALQRKFPGMQLAASAPSYQDMTGGMEKLTGGYTNYTPTSLYGKAAKNVISFVPAALAAAATGGMSAIPEALAYGAVAPGVAGALAKPVGTEIGRALDDENPERFGDWAKLGAEVLSGAGAAKFGPALSGIYKAELAGAGGIPSDIGKLEKFLGTKVTPGSLQADQELRGLALTKEMNTPKTANTIMEQGKQFSNGVLKSVGIDDDVARYHGKERLIADNVDDVVGKQASQIGKDIGETYDIIPKLGDAGPFSAGVQPLNVPLLNNIVKNGFPGMATFQRGQNVGQWIHDVRSAANEIVMGTHKSFDKSYLQRAKDLIKTIDSEVEQAVTPLQFEILQNANNQYSRLMTVKEALNSAKANGRTGMITPQDLAAAGGTRHTEDLSDIAELGSKYLLPRSKIPSIKDDKRNALRWALDLAGGAAGAGGSALMFGATPSNALKIGLTTLGGTLAADLLQSGVKAARGSAPAQAIARSRALYENPSLSQAAAIPATAEFSRQGRKSGGRVGGHEAEADQLVLAAERAKKGLSAHTEGLLNTPDDTVANALEIANRSI